MSTRRERSFLMLHGIIVLLACLQCINNVAAASAEIVSTTEPLTSSTSHDTTTPTEHITTSSSTASTTTTGTTHTSSTKANTTTPSVTTTPNSTPSTSTTSESTTSATTSKPAPKPKPQNHSLFYVTNPTNQAICLLVKANLNLQIKYHIQHKDSHREVNLPIDEAFVEGECNEGFDEKEQTQWMELRWNPAHVKTDKEENDWRLVLTFKKHSNGTIISLKNLELSLTASPKVFPGIKNETYMTEKHVGKLTTDHAPFNHSYRCNFEQNVALILTKIFYVRTADGSLGIKEFGASPIDNVTLQMSKLHFDAFRGDKKSKEFNKNVEICDADKANESHVNVAAAVFIPLLLLLLIGVGGYFAYKYYHRRRGPSYEGFN